MNTYFENPELNQIWDELIQAINGLVPVDYEGEPYIEGKGLKEIYEVLYHRTITGTRNVVSKMKLPQKIINPEQLVTPYDYLRAIATLQRCWIKQPYDGTDGQKQSLSDIRLNLQQAMEDGDDICTKICETSCEAECQDCQDDSCQDVCEAECQDCDSGCQSDCQIGCQYFCDVGADSCCEPNCDYQIEGCAVLCDSACDACDACDAPCDSCDTSCDDCQDCDTEGDGGCWVEEEGECCQINCDWSSEDY